MDYANTFDYGERYEAVFNRKGNRFGGRTKSDNISQTVNVYGQGEARHEHDPFNRGSIDSVDIPNSRRCHSYCRGCHFDRMI